ncbi:MAG: CRISPR-associated endonuclease Cas2 [candidate division WOR-3 bacterium]
MFIVITYDIKNDRRRSLILNTLKNFGRWVQYSVFECVLEPSQCDRLILKLSSLIKPSEDSIRFYIICEECKRKVIILGRGSVTEEEEVYIV